MQKYKTKTYRFMRDKWRNVECFDDILADYLQELDLFVGDNTTFLRMKDHTNNREIEYRAYTGNQITITIKCLNA